jgi:hypothetical protein
MAKTPFKMHPCYMAAAHILTGHRTDGILLSCMAGWGRDKKTTLTYQGDKGWSCFTREQWMLNTLLTLDEYNKALARLKAGEFFEYAHAKLYRTDTGRPSLWVRVLPETYKALDAIRSGIVCIRGRSPRIDEDMYTGMIKGQKERQSVIDKLKMKVASKQLSAEDKRSTATNLVAQGQRLSTKGNKSTSNKKINVYIPLEAERSATHKTLKSLQKDSREENKSREGKHSKSIKDSPETSLEEKEDSKKVHLGAHIGAESTSSDLPEEMKEVSAKILKEYEWYWKALNAQIYKESRSIASWSKAHKKYARRVITHALEIGSQEFLWEFTRDVVLNWDDAAMSVAEEMNAGKYDKHPSIVFIAARFQNFLDWHTPFKEKPPKPMPDKKEWSCINKIKVKTPEEVEREKLQEQRQKEEQRKREREVDGEILAEAEEAAYARKMDKVYELEVQEIEEFYQQEKQLYGEDTDEIG